MRPVWSPEVRGQRCYLVVFPKQLHANHSEDEDDDGEDERQVSQSAHGVSDDLDQGVEGRPRASKLEHPQLGGRKQRERISK